MCFGESLHEASVTAIGTGKADLIDVQSGLLGSAQVIVNRASTNAEAFGYLSGRK